MTTGTIRRVAAAAALATVVLAGGCGGGSDTRASDVDGRWNGGLGISFAGGQVFSGGFQMDLAQAGEAGEFASGIAFWTPIGETQSVAGPIKGAAVTLRLHFRCASVLSTGQTRLSTEIATLSGSVAGDTLTISSGTGAACALLGQPIAVTGANGAFQRSRDNLPL